MGTALSYLTQAGSVALGLYIVLLFQQLPIDRRTATRAALAGAIMLVVATVNFLVNDEWIPLVLLVGWFLVLALIMLIGNRRAERRSGAR